MNKQKEYRAWFVTIASFVIAILIIINKQEWNPFNTLVVGGGLGLGPLLISALSVWKGGSDSDRGTKVRSDSGEVGSKNDSIDNRQQPSRSVGKDSHTERLALALSFYCFGI